MKFDVYERVRDPLHGVGGVREGFAQVLDRCFSLRVHVLLLVLSSEYVLLGVTGRSYSRDAATSTSRRITDSADGIRLCVGGWVASASTPGSRPAPPRPPSRNIAPASSSRRTAHPACGRCIARRST